MTLEQAAQELNIDLEKSLDLVVNNRSLFIHLLRAYVSDSCLSDARQALAHKDYAAAAERVHSMKGAGASLGLDGMAGVCNDLVNAVRQEEYECVEELFAKVEQEHARLEAVIGKLDQKEET